MMITMVFESGKCYPPIFIAANLSLASLDGALAFIAFFQLARIHMRNKQAGWTRQKVLHLMIGSSNTGYFVYFLSMVVATCTKWHRWSNAWGFLLMAFPKILFLSAFLLLLSFWVDVCHQENDEEDEDEENSIQQSFLEKNTKAGSSSAHDHRKCCSFHGIHVGSRQKFVVAVQVVVLVFIVMISFAMFIWIGAGKNPIDSSLFAQVYVDVFAAAILITGGGIGCYGVILFFKLRKVRSEQVSSEMWKVSGLAIVSVVCFTVSAIVALLTNIPLFYHWNPSNLHGLKALILLLIYYFIGTTVPSGFVLWVMRDLPPQNAANIQEEPRRVAFVNCEAAGMQHQHWAATTISKNQVSKASPI